MTKGTARTPEEEAAGPPLSAEVARRVLAEVLPAGVAGRATVLFPEVLGETARRLASALEARGVSTGIVLSRERDFGGLPLEAAAASWVPPPGPDTPPLLVLFGAQPWSRPFEEDWRVELRAMENREALLRAGHRLLFVEWPRGARRDAEVDLRAAETSRLFERALDVDYDLVRRWNRRLAEALDGARDVRIRCPHGTDVRLSVAGRRFLPEDCRLGEDEPAVFLPGGEIYAPAVEDSAHGTVAFRSRGEPRLARFEGGLLVSLERADGTPDRELGQELGLGEEPLCELGCGTNPWAPPWQVGTLYEKSAGTVHVAVGGNAHFGGRRESPRHMDLVVRDPEVEVDGRPLALPPAEWRNPPVGGPP